MKIIRKPKFGRNYLGTIAIGEKYLKDWEVYCEHSWLTYCERWDLGLFLIEEDLVSTEDKKWKKPTWQKLLLGDAILKSDLDIENVCYLDTDIIISPLARNIFDDYDGRNFGLVSKRNNLPFDLNFVLRRVAFLRNRHYSDHYPLDSALFISIRDLYEYHKLEAQEDEACMGVILFNVERHHGLMRAWFYEYDRNIESITGGGDQTHLNFKIQSFKPPQWLPYEYQALWLYEMANYYPFLYEEGNRADKQLIMQCIESTLMRTSFLHFAGSWPESQMWKVGINFSSPRSAKDLNDFQNYLEKPVTGRPAGLLRPPSM